MRSLNISQTSESYSGLNMGTLNRFPERLVIRLLKGLGRDTRSPDEGLRRRGKAAVPSFFLHRLGGAVATETNRQPNHHAKTKAIITTPDGQRADRSLTNSWRSALSKRQSHHDSAICFSWAAEAVPCSTSLVIPDCGTKSVLSFRGTRLAVWDSRS
jgi:hypothetical protein